MQSMFAQQSEDTCPHSFYSIMGALLCGGFDKESKAYDRVLINISENLYASWVYPGSAREQIRIISINPDGVHFLMFQAHRNKNLGVGYYTPGDWEQLLS